jgi:hypothetical protein
LIPAGRTNELALAAGLFHFGTSETKKAGLRPGLAINFQE